MIGTTPTTQLLAHAIEVCALKQSVYAANVANAGVPGYQRLEVSFDSALQLAGLQMSSTSGGSATNASANFGSPVVVETHTAVKLDEEIGLMAKNALRYQVLLGALDRSMGSLRLAIREGRI